MLLGETVRILMLNNEFPPLGGGTAVVNYHLLRQFAADAECTVDLVTSSRGRRRYETERFAERVTLYKVPVDNRNVHHARSSELLRYAWRGLRLSRALAAAHEYDLSFAFAGVPAGAISYALKRMTGLPYIVSLQGDDVPGFAARYARLYPFLTPVIRRVWAGAGALTAISTEQQRLAHRCMPQAGIDIIYNGVDDRTFRPPESPRLGPEVNIVCVARLIERKGQHHLLHALAQLQAAGVSGVRLTLVGTGDAEQFLRRLAAELSVSEIVTFAGSVAHDQVPAVYRQADIFVLPSQNEGMSIALLEAMASGLPVIVTNGGGTAELVRAGVNGFVVPWADAAALARALETLVRDAVRRQCMGEQSRLVAMQHSWPAIAQSYLRLCHRVAHAPRAAPVLARSAARWRARRSSV